MKSECVSVSQIKLPALVFGKWGINAVETLEKLTVTSKSVFAKRGLIGARILDSGGVLYEVVDVQLKGYLSPFWGFRLFLQRQIRINLELKYVEKHASIETIKADLINQIRSNKFHWEASRPLAQWEREIASAADISRLIELFQ